jgi:zinc/manganese transport system substrate-binding protein
MRVRITLCGMLAAALLRPLLCPAELKVASLNPVVGDLARQVGGERVRVLELMKPGENPHLYEPSPDQLRQAHDADLVLAAGKGLEIYLPDLRDSLGRSKPLLEVGRKIPSLKADKGEIFICCPAHAGTTIDPHWWHSVINLQRAARIIEAEFARLDPDGRAYFRQRCREYERRLDDLASWIRREVHRIPRRDRILTTAHTAFGYFCRDFGFKSIPVQGLSTEDSADPAHLALVVAAIRRQGVRTVFPEKYVNTKLLEAVARETGIALGGYLLPGGPDPETPTCEAMMRHNVETMVKALAPKE